MQPATGDVFDLQKREDAALALKRMEAGDLDELVEVDEAEIDRLQKLDRKARRAALKGRPKIERDELKRRLFNQS